MVSMHDYLLGIVRNIDHEQEGLLVAENLLKWRRRARDFTLARLERERAELLGPERASDESLDNLIDRALLDDSALDRSFWLDALADFVVAAPDSQRDHRYHQAARRILATFRAEPRSRHQAVRFIASRLAPLV